MLLEKRVLRIIVKINFAQQIIHKLTSFFKNHSFCFIKKIQARHILKYKPLNKPTESYNGRLLTRNKLTHPKNTSP